ncbi:MAG: HAMP domain-containing protein [Gemmatimonadota bacterium]|nr:MAG: HAMP domain-containing protein [Gemmatimonadota bacterium]
MTIRRILSLRTSFLLILLFGAFLPLGLLGLYLNRSAARSGEELVRTRLERGLRDAVTGMGARWVTQRTALLELAEHPEVQRRLISPDSIAGTPLTSAALGELAEGIGDFADAVVVRDNASTVLWQTTAVPGEFRNDVRSSARLPVELPVYDSESGRRIGTIEARLLVSRLAPGGGSWYGIGGSVLGLFDPRTGDPLLPLTIDPERFQQPRFTWANESWLSVSHTLREPPLDIVLAAPLGPFTEPFERTARRGTLALIVIALIAFTLATLVTGRLTRSLGRLAAAADAVSAGDLDRRVEETGGNETRRVAHAFNTMVTSLRETLTRLTQKESLAAVGEFATSLAHEVRNPLTSVRLILQKAKASSDDPNCSELISTALSTLDGLNRTVSGVLSVAQSGLVNAQTIDLRDPLAAAMRTAEPEFQDRGARLEPLAGSTPVRVHGDAAALERLFLNLLRNAAQALGAQGRASVGLEVTGDVATVSIVDSGPGIPKDDLERVFEPFYSTRADGTGLGLAIARQIVTAHGGELTIASQEGHGTEVRVTLPLTRHA